MSRSTVGVRTWYMYHKQKNQTLPSGAGNAFVIYVYPHKTLTVIAVADLGGRTRRAPSPPTAQNFLNFMQFFAKFGKIICWHPPPEGWRPLLRGILDPPLYCIYRTNPKLISQGYLNREDITSKYRQAWIPS